MKKLNRKARRAALHAAASKAVTQQQATPTPWTPAIAAEISRGDRTVVAICNFVAQGLRDSADIPDKDAHYTESLVRVSLANAVRAFGHALGDACTHYGIALPMDAVTVSTVITEETLAMTAKALRDFGHDPKIMAHQRPGQVIDSVLIRLTDLRLSTQERELPIAFISSTLYSGTTMPPDERPDNEGICARMRQAEERTPTERTAQALIPLILFDAAMRLPGRVAPQPAYWSPPIEGSAPGRVGGATMAFTMLHEPIPGTIVSTTLTLCLEQMTKLAAKLDTKRH